MKIDIDQSLGQVDKISEGFSLSMKIDIYQSSRSKVNQTN